MAMVMATRPPHPFLQIILFLLASSLNPLTIRSEWSPPFPPCNQSFPRMNSSANSILYRPLPSLGAVLSLCYYNTTPNATIDVVFSADLPSKEGWVAWGLNPRRPHMVGTRALVAFLQQGALVAHVYNLTSDIQQGCSVPISSQIELDVMILKANYSADTGSVMLMARLGLPPEYNVSTLNHVWQVGSEMVVGGYPKMHDRRLANFDSRETINVLLDGHVVGPGKNRARNLRYAHAVMNVVSWGFLLPSGIICSRYGRTFQFLNHLWEQIHIAFEILAYGIGITSWALGLYLGSNNKRTFETHKDIGITIFVLATFQIMALWLKPNKKDIYRKRWNLYHHFLGYTLLTLIIINIFKGFAILRPPPPWRIAYIVLITIISSIAAILETIVCRRFYLKRRKNENLKKDPTDQQPDKKEPTPIMPE